MHILRTIETFYPYVTGPTNQAFRISWELEKRGFHSPILTTYCDVSTQLPSQENYQGVEVTRYRNQFRLMRYCMSLGMIKGFKEFDLIHSHNYRNFQADLGVFFSQWKRKPFVLSTHGSLLGYKRYLEGKTAHLPYVLYDFLTFKFTARRADRIVVSSQIEYEDALEFGIGEEELRLIPAGIDLPQGELSDHKKRECLTLLFVGRIVRNRKLEILIRALPEIANGVELTIVGSEEKTSSVARGGYLEELITLARRLGVDKRVHFTGPRYGDALIACYCSADIFVYASQYESFGQPLLEAAAAGLPVVSTPVGVAKELVKDGETGYVIEFDNPSMLAARVGLLLDWQVRKKYSEQLKELVRSNFSWDGIINRYVQIYRDLTP
jgi:glycosyltransferase involved in cell wall biosynthesis